MCATLKSIAVLHDDLSNICSLDTLELLNSPKAVTGKAPSIFSPEWNEKSSSMLGNKSSSLQSNMEHGANGSENKSANLSPKKEYNKRAMSSNDTINKKDKHIEEQPQQQQQQQISHRTSSSSQMDKSMRIKRESISISGMQYDTNLPQNLLDNKAVKRSYNADPLNQSENSDHQHREAKHRKTEPISPTNILNDPNKSGVSSKSFSSSSLNGIETNPDLVSSLLKESLSDVKFGASTLDVQMKKMPSSVPQQDPNTNYNLQQQIFDQREQQAQQSIKTEPFEHSNLDRSQRNNQNQYQVNQHHHQQYKLNPTELGADVQKQYQQVCFTLIRFRYTYFVPI